MGLLKLDQVMKSFKLNKSFIYQGNTRYLLKLLTTVFIV
ncbi:hypothetical protein K661_00501 [Piscirickettsia salmonis LF-89 = ATCC VR-1361]|nr:hypothetical protein K661_00501 [Piscirickettsia salmonis LF-89 = ATCC VR-1361]